LVTQSALSSSVSAGDGDGVCSDDGGTRGCCVSLADEDLDGERGTDGETGLDGAREPDWEPDGEPDLERVADLVGEWEPDGERVADLVGEREPDGEPGLDWVRVPDLVGERETDLDSASETDLDEAPEPGLDLSGEPDLIAISRSVTTADEDARAPGLGPARRPSGCWRWDRFSPARDPSPSPCCSPTAPSWFCAGKAAPPWFCAGATTGRTGGLFMNRYTHTMSCPLAHRIAVALGTCNTQAEEMINYY
jgi:hypothetical protein